MLAESVNLETLLAKGGELPTLPEVYLRVSEQLEDVDSSAHSIGETISTDPAISSNILKMVNSAYYGLPSQISSVSQAIALLGRLRLKQVLIGAVLGDVFKGHNCEHFSMQEFWRHSIRTAIIARYLAEESDFNGEPETIFTVGLLHDVGRLILVATMPEILQEIDQRAISQRISIDQAELDIIGFAHTDIGAALMQKWGFPDLIWVSVLNHHNAYYTGPFFNAAHLTYLANRLAHYVPPMDEGETEDILQEIPNWQGSNVPIVTICRACQIAEEMVFEVMESLGMVNMEISAD